MTRRRETGSEFEPRHRILGAVVLVALGFILFSVVLNEQPQRLGPDEKVVAVAPDTRVVITSVPRAKATLVVQTRVVDNPLAPRHLAEKHDLATVPAKPDRIEPSQPVVAKAAPVRKVVQSAKKIAKAGGKRWMVQVGTFSNPANARRLGEKLKNQKYRVVMKVVALKKGRAVRVRVGPFNNIQSATDARDRINKKNGIKGVVLAQK